MLCPYFLLWILCAFHPFRAESQRCRTLRFCLLSALSILTFQLIYLHYFHFSIVMNISGWEWTIFLLASYLFCFTFLVSLFLHFWALFKLAFTLLFSVPVSFFSECLGFLAFLTITNFQLNSTVFWGNTLPVCLHRTIACLCVGPLGLCARTATYVTLQFSFSNTAAPQGEHKHLARTRVFHTHPFPCYGCLQRRPFKRCPNCLSPAIIF